jgi:hypothetical protein
MPAEETKVEETKAEDADPAKATEEKPDEPGFKSTLLWDDKMNKTTGRWLSHSPFFTDGQFFYVISTLKDVRKLEEDEERQPLKWVLEKYDPSTSKFLHVSSTVLYKAKDEP